MHAHPYVVGLLALATEALSLTLSVASTPQNASSPLLYGLFFEDIYHSGDGGMYGELIRNRAFQGTQDGNGQTGSPSLTPTTRYWSAVGSGVSLSIDSSTPQLTTALASHMRVSVPSGASGPVGFCNEGYYGFSVDSAKRYIADLYIRGAYTGNMTTYFQSTISGQRFSAINTTVSQTSSQGWKQYYTNAFNPTSTASNANNTLCFTFDGSKLAGQSIYVNLISAFKQTFNNRMNGLREDLALALLDMNQGYLRLPGGNNLEGNAPPYFLNWTHTVGPLEHRPGFPGTWGSTQTNGLGLVELMQWAEDMNLVVVLGVWGGLYLNGATIAQSDLTPYVQLALDEMEFLTGDTSTKYGALRAQDGRAAPFKVPYIKIGNEDFLNNGYILNYFQEGKSHMVLISTSPGEGSGAIGIVTLEDVLEEIIGEEIIDESDAFDQTHRPLKRLIPALKRQKANRVRTSDVADEAAADQEPLLAGGDDGTSISRSGSMTEKSIVVNGVEKVVLEMEIVPDTSTQNHARDGERSPGS